MQPLQITFRNIQPSKTIERLVRQKARKLEKIFDRIVKCHVTLGAQQHSHHKGNLYDAHIDVQIPGKSFAATSTRHDNQAHESLSSAVRHAFEAAGRQLHDYTESRREGPRPSIENTP
jgi:ribosome-associated translation inhibitor RaiA